MWVVVLVNVDVRSAVQQAWLDEAHSLVGLDLVGGSFMFGSLLVVFFVDAVVVVLL